MTGEFSDAWLALREPADASARATGLLAHLPQNIRKIRDLGCGTGSLARWLAPQLPKPQHWVLADRDPALLDFARAKTVIDGVTIETALSDVTALTADDLRDTDLVTCSALLDILTAEQIGDLVRACAASGTPALFTLSVTGEVRFDPPMAEDAAFEDAFNAHQRRGKLLGPDAPVAAVAAFEEAGATVFTAPTPWELGAAYPELTKEWLAGWVGAATEQRPDLRGDAYLTSRTGDLPGVSVGHADVLAIFG